MRFALWLCPALLWAGHNALVPQPQKIRYGRASLALDELSVCLASPAAAEERFAAQTLAQALGGLPVRERSSARCITLARTGAPAPLPEADERPGPDSRESYRLRVTSFGAEIRARSSAGLYYGAQTLAQLVEGKALPEVEIEDWPAMPYRGVMIDVSHGALPTPAEIRRQIDFLARWKGNQYYLYSELSIELNGYSIVNPGARYSQEEIRGVIQYARERHVDVVPCLEFYGHLHDLFRLERYANLAPLPHGGDINPVNPRIQAILKDWIAQMAALFPSPWFHIGLDEPWELERAGSAAAGGVAPSELYLDHLKRMAALVRSHGKRVLFWADMTAGAALFERYPDLATRLPAETIAVPWHYHVEKDFTRMLAPFTKAKVPHVIGTGIWAWDTITPDFTRTFANIDGFLADARKSGACGMINTNWADDAQMLYRNTLAGIAYGAAAAWQPAPMDRARFFENYAARFYPPDAAAEMAPALATLDRAQQAIIRALGSEDMNRLWDDVFAPDRLARAQANLEDLRGARLLAEEAQERLYRVRDSYSVPGLLLGARLIDYAGMKYIYAAEIADIFKNKVGPGATRADISFWLGRQASDRNHGRIGDLMDTITELREQYRQAWNAEYLPYRQGAALGRFDGEYEYWRKFQARLWEVRRTYKEGDKLPSLDSLRP